MTKTQAFSALVLLAVAACNREAQQQDQPATSTTSTTSSAAGSSPYEHRHRAPPIATEPAASLPRPVAPSNPTQPARQPTATTRLVSAGTRIEATTRDSISSEHGRAGQTTMATVSRDVTDGSGNVLIPAGSPLTLTITEIQPAANSSDSDGTVVLAVTSVNVRGTEYPLNAELESVPHVLVGHGVTLGSAEKVGVGAAIGAIAGRIIGRNTRGAVIGGAIGAGAGVIVAAHTQDRDVVIPSGTPIVLALNQSLSVAR